MKVAILDLYNRTPNEGMRCIRNLVAGYAAPGEPPLTYEIFETRHDGRVPHPDDFDVYISTGGPGNPYDGRGQAWEKNYFGLIDRLWAHNQRGNDRRKHVFFICHSFQMMTRHFGLGHVSQRNSTSFGIFPVHLTAAGRRDPAFVALDDPFFAVDSRDWQVVQPNRARLAELGGEITALEKHRPHVDLERAVMAIRLSDEFMGVQFHPEADAQGMLAYFSKPEKKVAVIKAHGDQKYQAMLRYLRDPQKIARTQQTILPTFLQTALRVGQEV